VGSLRVAVGLLLLLWPRVVFAQAPVVQWADWVSYGTAAVNPAIGVVSAWRSDQRWCRLGQIGISELVGNGSTLAIKHFVRSARPCLDCPADGMPSGHSMNSVIGVSQYDLGLRLGWTFSWGTQQLRGEAHRHTKTQRAAGLLIGAGAEFAGHLLKCGP